MLAYEEFDGEEDGNDICAYSEVIPPGYGPVSGQPVPEVVGRFLATVGGLGRLHAFFPGPFSRAVQELTALDQSPWFAGALPDSLASQILREEAQRRQQAPEKVSYGEAADCFGYGEVTDDTEMAEDAEFGYGEFTPPTLPADFFLVRFSRHANAYAVVVLDSRRGIIKYLVRQNRQGLFVSKGKHFPSIAAVAAHWSERGFGTVSAASWASNHSLVLDELFSNWLERSSGALFCKSSEEKELWNAPCPFYGKASDEILAQLMMDAQNPKAFCLRFGSSPGTFTLAVSKPDKQGTNKKFPHYFKFSVSGRAEKLSLKGWKDGSPPNECNLQELAAWLQGEGYVPFCGPGMWGRPLARVNVDAAGSGVVRMADLIGAWDVEGRLGLTDEVWYARQHDLEADLLAQVLVDSTQISEMVVDSLRKRFKQVELREFGALTLAVVEERPDVAALWLSVVEELVPKVFLQSPLLTVGHCVSFVDSRGAIFDVMLCIDGKKILERDGEYRSLPPLVPMSRLWLHTACLLSKGELRSDVLDILRSMRGGGSLKEVVSMLPWLSSRQGSPTAMLAAALASNQSEVLAGLPTRSASFLQKLRSSIGASQPTNSRPLSMIPPNLIELEHRIGGGQFGEVWLAKLGGRINIQVAVKKLLSRDKALEKEIMHEAALLDRLRHPAVVEYFGMSRDSEGRLLVVTELMSGGSLLSWICSIPKDAERARCTIAKDLCIGIGYIHLVGVVHRDIAARNVLLAGSDPIRVKLCDFGLGLEMESQDENQKIPLAVPWAAPEALRYKFSPQSDIWSYAVTLVELYGEGRQLYDGWGSTSPYTRDIKGFIQELKDGKRLARPLICPAELYEVMVKCWAFEPDERCSLEDVLDVLDVIEVALATAEGENRLDALEEFDSPVYLDDTNTYTYV